MNLRVAFAAMLLLAAPTVLRAQPIQGLYVGAGAGGNLPQDAKTDRAIRLGGSPNLKTSYAVGELGLGSIGYGLGNGWRFEVEGNYRTNDIHNITKSSGPRTADGRQFTTGVMVNALFDLDIGLPWLFPYFGGGAGYEWTDMDNVNLTARNGVHVLSISGLSGKPAYQGIAGLGFPIPGVPGLSVTAEYRFLGVFGPQHFNASDASTGVATISNGVKLKDNYNHSVLLGVRYAFDVPPPAVPAVAAMPVAAPARSYLVFFDWDRATLTDRARQIIAEAAHAIPTVQHTRIGVNGYTDTSGTPKYNQGLSIRRAQAVAAELVRLGVAKTEIAIQGFGETHLLVPTAAGVREPQNRRVEIIIQ